MDRLSAECALEAANVIEVRGRLSRTEWEVVYVAAMKFAEKVGLTIDLFELQAAEFSGHKRMPAETADTTPASPSG